MGFRSAVLAVMQFGGGAMILAGLLTRPVALANAAMLAITFWFHWTHFYGNVALTAEGMTAAQAAGQALLTDAGVRNLAADGGAMFLAAFGAGPLSLDRAILKREF